MLPNLLAKVLLWRRQYAIADSLRLIVLRMRGPHDVRDRREESRAFVQHGMADIHVIEEHVRRLGEAAVLDAIEQTDFGAADVCLDAPVEAQVFAEHSRLVDDSFRPKHAAIAVPALAIAGQTRGDQRHAAVQGMAHGSSAGIIVGFGRNFRWAERVIEPARHQEPRKRPQPAKSSFAFGLVEGGVAEACR